MKHRRLFQAILAQFLVCTLALPLFLTVAKAQASGPGNNRFNVIVVLDASGSMKHTDPYGYRFEAISQFTYLLAEQGNVLGSVVFHTDVAAEQTPAPLSDQAGKETALELIEAVPDNGSWTNIGVGLSRAVSMIETDGDPTLPSVILFLSDGNTDMPTKDDLQASLDLKADAIQAAREQGISIYSVCLNANRTADVTEMQQISAATGGVFLEIAKAEDLQEVFNTFYNLIYGTSTVTLFDETFPASGRLETTFDVPGLGVEEVNIIIYGSTSKKSLLRPDGTESTAVPIESNTFSMLKLTDIIPGSWTLITEGIPGDSIKINMVYNVNLGIDVTMAPKTQTINPADSVIFTAKLSGNSIAATDPQQYVGYSARLQIMDAYGDNLESIPMEVVNDHFEVVHSFEEGSYYYKVTVAGNHIEKESPSFGPLTSTFSVLTEEEKNNTPPVPVREIVEESVTIWPFKGGNYTLDLNTLATDAQDDTLKYKIVSSSFIQGTDYTVDDVGILHMDNFSLSKGAYTIRATDSGGLSCDIEVIIRAYNIGLMALIGIAVLVLIGVAVFGILLYIALSKPFRGTISVQSYCNGTFRGTPKNPHRGRCKLSVFGMDNIGLDYHKSYFQATGQNYIYLITPRNQPVIWNGKPSNKVRIQSGAEVTLSVQQGDSRLLYVRFDSRMNQSLRRRPPQGARKPVQPRRR